MEDRLLTEEEMEDIHGGWTRDSQYHNIARNIAKAQDKKSSQATAREIIDTVREMFWFDNESHEELAGQKFTGRAIYETFKELEQKYLKD